ncbi:MAG: porin family protein [Prevotellaceae bacterium]|jgi:hypothetical protein|nr:porin family protein [Prevotellaceae bacterium]
MKKIILSAVFIMAIIVSANAQEHKWFIGGAVGFDSKKHEDMKTKTFLIAPEIGYNLSNHFAIATSLKYAHINMKSSAVKGNINGFEISPYIRYTFLKKGIVSAFVDANADFGLGDIDGFAAGLKPGVSVSVTERFNVVAHVGFLGYNDGKGVGSYQDGKGFIFDLSGYQTSFGFYYSF